MPAICVLALFMVLALVLLGVALFAPLDVARRHMQVRPGFVEGVICSAALVAAVIGACWGFAP